MTSARLVQLSRAATAEFFSTRKVLGPSSGHFVPFFFWMKVVDDQKKTPSESDALKFCETPNVVLKHDTKDSISLA